MLTFWEIGCHLVGRKGVVHFKLGVSTFYAPRLTSCLLKPEAILDQNIYMICFVFRCTGCSQNIRSSPKNMQVYERVVHIELQLSSRHVREVSCSYINHILLTPQTASIETDKLLGFSVSSSLRTELNFLLPNTYESNRYIIPLLLLLLSSSSTTSPPRSPQ